jgi:hypothetical protein
MSGPCWDLNDSAAPSREIWRKIPIKIRGSRSTYQEIEDDLKRPGKDFWDRLNTLSGVISGVLVAAIGFYATQVYDKRSREAERQDADRSVVAVELQTLEKFFLHLVSQNETEKQAAIEAISFLANSDLATKIAKIMGGPGARAALTNIAVSAPPATRSPIESALGDLYKAFSGSIVQTIVRVDNRETRGTGFFISKDGYLLSTAHQIDVELESKTATFEVISQSGARHEAVPLHPRPGRPKEITGRSFNSGISNASRPRQRPQDHAITAD